MKKTYLLAFALTAAAAAMTSCGSNIKVSENTSADTLSSVSDSSVPAEKISETDTTSSEDTDNAETKQLSSSTQETAFTERDL